MKSRGHTKLAAFFLLLAVAGAQIADELVERGLAKYADWLIFAVCGLGFLGVLVNRLLARRKLMRDIQSYLARIHAETERYRALFEGSADMLLIVDPASGAIRERNALARELVGNTAPNLFELLEESERAAFSAAVREAVRARADPRTLTELHIAAHDGRRLSVDVRFTPLYTDGKHFVQVALRDQTRAREMERELAIRERLSSLGLLTAGVAHEINNPLEGIGNHLALLERTELAPEVRARHIESVRHGLERIRDLVRDLLRFARPQSEGGRADLAQVVENARKLVALSERLKGVEIASAGLDRPLFVVGDAGRLEQVVVNLLLNAGNALRGRGRVRIAAQGTPAPGDITLTVEDDGPGIAPEHLARLFDPFFSTGEGSGLGLSVSYGIVRAHGGTLAAENRPEGGARFIVRLRAPAPDA